MLITKSQGSFTLYCGTDGGRSFDAGTHVPRDHVSSNDSTGGACNLLARQTSLARILQSGCPWTPAGSSEPDFITHTFGYISSVGRLLVLTDTSFKEVTEVRQQVDRRRSSVSAGLMVGGSSLLMASVI